MFAAIPNRVAPYLSEPKKTLPPMPATREGREAVLTDAVFAAITALQGLLTHHDPKVVMRAAEMILNLETTRQRHGRVMIGLGMPERVLLARRADAEEPLAERAEHSEEPLAERAEHFPDDLPDEPDDELIEVVRSGLQQDADAKGTGEKVSWAKAKQAARAGLAFIRQQVNETGEGDPIGSVGPRGSRPLRNAGGTPAVQECGTHPVAHAAATTAAVSTRSTRGPNDSGRHPTATAAATSSGLNPPSGPTARATP